MIFKVTLTRGKRVTLAAFILLLTASVVHAHSGTLNRVALDVCGNKSKSQACQYEGGHNDLYIGTCQYISEDALTCVRNQPIQKIDPEMDESEANHKHAKVKL